jgi:hypothetical protein
MNNALRLSEKWFTRGLWLVAVIFAGFLMGLGNAIVGDLPKVERGRTLDDFIEKRSATACAGAPSRPSWPCARRGRRSNKPAKAQTRRFRCSKRP